MRGKKIKIKKPKIRGVCSKSRELKEKGYKKAKKQRKNKNYMMLMLSVNLSAMCSKTISQRFKLQIHQQVPNAELTSLTSERFKHGTQNFIAFIFEDPISTQFKWFGKYHIGAIQWFCKYDLLCKISSLHKSFLTKTVCIHQ